MAVSPEKLDGINDFLADLQEYEKSVSAEHLQEVLMVGGEAVAEDIRKLPKPRRKRTTHSHMLDTVAAMPNNRTVHVGWGKEGYYGFFLEHGTTKMAAQPHIMPTWEKNKAHYYDLMKQKLFEKVGG